MDLSSGAGALYEGPCRGKSDLTVTISDADFVALMQGKLDPKQAFMSGKLKMKGNLMLMQKLAVILKDPAKL